MVVAATELVLSSTTSGAADDDDDDDVESNNEDIDVDVKENAELSCWYDDCLNVSVFQRRLLLVLPKWWCLLFGVCNW